MRYKVERVPFYRVVDTEAAQDPLPIHYEGSDKEFADQLAGDMNTNHTNRVEALERIQQEALQQHAVQISEHGLGQDKS